MHTLRAAFAAMVLVFAGSVVAQTTAGTGTTIVVPVTAQTASFTSEATVYNPNGAPITVDVQFYEANNSSTPGPKTCADLVVPANRSAQFTLAAQCTLAAGSHFGLLVLADVAGTHPFYGFVRTQNPQGIGFSTEGFPAGNFNDQVSHATGLKKTTTGLIYQTNCFVGSMSQPVSYTLKLFNDSTGAQIGGTLSGSLAAFQQFRYLDVFGANGVNAPNVDQMNVRAEFTPTTAATLVGFCTVQENTSFGADFRIAKSYGTPGTLTSLAQGTGITLTPNPITTTGTIAVDTTVIQSRVTGTCSAGSSIRTINANGTVVCEADDVGSGTVTSVGSGTGLTGGPITTSGTLSVNTTTIQARVTGTCAVGNYIRAIASDGTVTCGVDGPANAFVQNGNAFGATAVLGTTDAQPLELYSQNQRVARFAIVAAGVNVIGGVAGNSVDAPAGGGTIGGGGESGSPNRVTSNFGTVAGGIGNRAGPPSNLAGNQYPTVGGGFGNTAGSYADTVGGGYGNSTFGTVATIGGGNMNQATGVSSTIAGGNLNEVTATESTVGGGYHNRATNFGATIGGGQNNLASGHSATIPGGNDNVAAGDYSFAAGRGALNSDAAHTGVFLFADNANAFFTSQAANEFAVRATGGFRFVTAINAGAVPTWTCTLTTGSGWACSSDRALKRNLVPLDGEAILAKLRDLPVYQWEPEGVSPTVLHAGPTAQDFRQAFGLGVDDKTIGFQDVDGIVLAALKGVNAKLDSALRERDAIIAAQAARQAALERQVADLSGELADARLLRADLIALKAALAELQRERPAVAAR